MPRRQPRGRKSTRKSSREAPASDRFRTVQEELQSLRSRVAELERLAAIGQLGTIVARQAWNPLTSLALSIDLLARRTEDSDTLTRLSEIAAERRRLSNLLKDFLEFAELRPPRNEPLDLQDVVQSVINVNRPFLRSGVDLQISIGTTPARVHGDVLQIRKAISGVVHRAFDVTQEGSVAVLLRREQDRWSVVVEDSGPRLSADERLRLFEPRFGTEGAARDRIYLELYFAKNTIAGHGGDIQVDATSCGTALRIWLPSS